MYLVESTHSIVRVCTSRNQLWPLHTPTGQVLHQEGGTQAPQGWPEEVPRGCGYIIARQISCRLVVAALRPASHTTSCGLTEVSIMRTRRVCSRLLVCSSSFVRESHIYIMHVQHTHRLLLSVHQPPTGTQMVDGENTWLKKGCYGVSHLVCHCTYTHHTNRCSYYIH